MEKDQIKKGLVIINRKYLKENEDFIGERIIYVTLGEITFSKGALGALKIKEGDRINLATGVGNSKKIYLFKASPDDSDAFVIKHINKKSMGIRISRLSGLLLLPFRSRKLQFLVSMEPEKNQGHSLYRLIPIEEKKQGKTPKKEQGYEL